MYWHLEKKKLGNCLSENKILIIPQDRVRNRKIKIEKRLLIEKIIKRGRKSFK